MSPGLNAHDLYVAAVKNSGLT